MIEFIGYAGIALLATYGMGLVGLNCWILLRRTKPAQKKSGRAIQPAGGAKTFSPCDAYCAAALNPSQPLMGVTFK